MTVSSNSRVKVSCGIRFNKMCKEYFFKKMISFQSWKYKIIKGHLNILQIAFVGYSVGIRVREIIECPN